MSPSIRRHLVFSMVWFAPLLLAWEGGVNVAFQLDAIRSLFILLLVTTLVESIGDAFFQSTVGEILTGRATPPLLSRMAPWGSMALEVLFVWRLDRLVSFCFLSAVAALLAASVGIREVPGPFWGSLSLWVLMRVAAALTAHPGLKSLSEVKDYMREELEEDRI